MKVFLKENWDHLINILLVTILFGLMFVRGFYILAPNVDDPALFDIGNGFAFIFKSKTDGALPVTILNLFFPLLLLGNLLSHVAGIIRKSSKFGPLVIMIFVWTFYFMSWHINIANNALKWVFPLMLLAITITSSIGTYFRNRYATPD